MRMQHWVKGSWLLMFHALGPVAFMHRLSASENASATLAHHLQDSTHIVFGMITTGFTYRWFKLEGSIFNEWPRISHDRKLVAALMFRGAIMVR